SALFVAWGATLAGVLREGGEGTAAGVVIAATAGGIVLATIPAAFSAGLDEAARRSDPAFMRGSYQVAAYFGHVAFWFAVSAAVAIAVAGGRIFRSEEHTSELQSQSNLVCRLLLEKKKKQDRR